MEVQRASGLGTKQYKHLVVAIGINDLPTRTLAEEAFALERATEADVLTSVSLLEANRGYEPDEMQRIFVRNGADAVAIVSVDRVGRDSVRFSNNQQPGYICLLWAGRTCRQWGISSSARAEETRPWMHFNIELYEMGTGRMMWTAAVRTNGKRTETPEDILRRLAHDVIQSWQKDGVLTKPGALARR
jgi:hypothetical protein